MDLLSLLIPAALATDLGNSVPRDPSVDCLVPNTIYEARGESIEGQLAVIEVVYVRAQRSDFPDSPCSVIEQPWQFSWLNKNAPPQKEPTEAEINTAQRVVFSFKYNNLPRTSVYGATHYLNPDKIPEDKLPDWYYEYEFMGRIGNHEFFRRPVYPWVASSDVPY